MSHPDTAWTCPECGRRFHREAVHNCRPEKSRGLGDTIAKTIQKVSRGRVKPCKTCKKRQAKLNELFPYKPTT